MQDINKMKKCKECKLYRDISQLNKKGICIRCRQRYYKPKEMRKYVRKEKSK